MRVDYELMTAQAVGFLETEPGFVPFLSNLSALIYQTLPDLNWAGFYTVTEDGGLLLGPFQGKVACIRLGKGKGVCGAALTQNEVMLVPDVHAFPGHIACDSASNSEIVLPMHDAEGRQRAVLDIDSPLLGRFTEEDAAGLAALVAAVETKIAW